MKEFTIITFYEFRPLNGLEEMKSRILESMRSRSVFGTVILADEGFNSTVSGRSENLDEFVTDLELIFGTKLNVKTALHDKAPFKRQKVKIKREIVTLRKTVDLKLGEGTHVSSREWNRIITDPETLVLDARNSYEVRIGKFRNAHDPGTKSFSELPDFADKNLDPAVHKRVAMYCTGGVRCEKFAPYLKQKGFEEVYQLTGGVLGYLDETSASESLWEGECFVFDERVSVDEDLEKGAAIDHSAEKNRRV